ncbi:zf-HC2 domain-containing protein [Anaerotignum sp.]|uniref:zf-HC2 domain-containing protein n=1 Tax=Anaerotignum sp. TaxID=2039241 RepID=UPI00289B1318|nr:zf-HC2 domain-containing protein [Anaerotignum sp.]
MSLNCDIVKDLVALYHDGVASEASDSAVEAHLKECKSCRNYYKQYGHGQPASLKFDVNASGDYGELAKHMRIRRLWMLVSALAYVSASLCAFIMLFMRIRRK